MSLSTITNWLIMKMGSLTTCTYLLIYWRDVECFLTRSAFSFLILLCRYAGEDWQLWFEKDCVLKYISGYFETEHNLWCTIIKTGSNQIKYATCWISVVKLFIILVLTQLLVKIKGCSLTKYLRRYVSAPFTMYEHIVVSTNLILVSIYAIHLPGFLW